MTRTPRSEPDGATAKDFASAPDRTGPLLEKLGPCQCGVGLLVTNRFSSIRLAARPAARVYKIPLPIILVARPDDPASARMPIPSTTMAISTSTSVTPVRVCLTGPPVQPGSHKLLQSGPQTGTRSTRDGVEERGERGERWN